MQIKKELSNQRRRVVKSDNKNQSIQCPECFKVFSGPSGLRLHMPKHTGQFKFWCGKCQRDFSCRANYQAHMDKHEGITFPCQKCTKRFKTKISLNYHQSEHTGIYLYRCSVCNKGFNLKGNFAKHQAACK